MQWKEVVQVLCFSKTFCLLKCTWIPNSCEAVDAYASHETISILSPSMSCLSDATGMSAI